jgi:hypothetical protein
MTYSKHYSIVLQVMLQNGRFHCLTDPDSNFSLEEVYIIRELESEGWVEFVEVKNGVETYHLTEDGREKAKFLVYL